MSRLGTSAAEASKAFQDLVECFGGIPYEEVQVPISLEHVAIVDRAPLPWYKRLWSWLTGERFQSTKTTPPATGNTHE